MSLELILSQFSKTRLNGEPVPRDVQLLLEHSEELVERTGISLNWNEDWAPWLDTSYLRPEERTNADIIANLQAINDVCQLIAFVAMDDEDQYLGYWRGPTNRKVADSPFVLLDNEGQFNLNAGTNLAEAILANTYGQDRFDALRDWLRSLGFLIRYKNVDEIPYPIEEHSPHDMHTNLFRNLRERRES
jgi:hypothetical protein